MKRTRSQFFHCVQNIKLSLDHCIISPFATRKFHPATQLFFCTCMNLFLIFFNVPPPSPFATGKIYIYRVEYIFCLLYFALLNGERILNGGALAVLLWMRALFHNCNFMWFGIKLENSPKKYIVFN